MPQGSKIFLPNRALGYVSNHIPLQVRYIKNRRENLITTCVGKFFHTYGVSHFTLLSVSGLHPDDITSVGSDAFHIYTSCENVIYAWRRGTELKHTYRGHTKPVHLIMPFGAHLLSIDEHSCLKVWDIKTEDLYVEFTFSNDVFKITTILHPNTYINKILLGSDQGSMQLWNIKTSKLIYSFKGWESSITCLEQAPAIDVAAVGLANGKIILHNLKFDETVMEFTQDWGLVTAISFRTDDHAVMATGSVQGHIVFWNLEERKVDTQLMLAHDSSVTGMQFLSNEPLMVTSSPDNTLKLWIFDMTDGGPRLLRIREGHSVTPNLIRFHGANSHNLLSAGGDSTIRIFNTQTETFNKSLGKASYNRKASKRRGRTEKDPLKMPPIMEFTSETAREKEWDNIAAIHLGIPTVTTWSYDKLKMSDLKLLPTRYHKKNRDLDTRVAATCLCLSHCGNFVIIGYSSGHVDRFNIQSGLHRDSYGESVAHHTPVRGVIADALNSIVVTGGSDAYLKFWAFKCKQTKFKTKLLLEESIAFLRGHRESSMVAIVLEDFTVNILDLDTRIIIRKFFGHTAQLTDATFSPDSRWLITSSMDCTIKTWNIPSGQLIDHFRMNAACISLSLSPIGDMLATAHVDYLGVFLWANRTLYSNISLKALSSTSEAPLVELPDCSKEHESDDEEEEIDEPEFKSPEQISHDLVTLSTLANSRWQNLLNIDIIKRKNKPKSPLKKPQMAPFFLPTIPSLNFQFDMNAATAEEENSKIIHPQSFLNFSPFAKILHNSETDFEEIIAKLKSMGPSMIDFEIKSLSPDAGGSTDLILKFFKCLETMMQSNKDFELAQAYLAVFLKNHGNVIAAEKNLRDYLANLQSCQHAGWDRIQESLFYNICVIQSLKNI